MSGHTAMKSDFVVAVQRVADSLSGPNGNETLSSARRKLIILIGYVLIATVVFTMMFVMTGEGTTLVKITGHAQSEMVHEIETIKRSNEEVIPPKKESAGVELDDDDEAKVERPLNVDINEEILEPPFHKLIYGLFREPRIENLDNTTMIPRIVHQTWKGTMLPSTLKPYIQTWKKMNPKWEYWFWTDADARLLVQTRFPHLTDMFLGFKHPLQRADIIRYLILYEFGGVYADLDVEALRPLDNFTSAHRCIIGNEPMLHTNVIWGRSRLPCNAFMAATPRHSFFRFLIRMLPIYDARTRNKEVMRKTGPLMLARAMTDYEHSYMFVKQMADIKPDEMCYLAPPEEAMPSFDPRAKTFFKHKCSVKRHTLKAKGRVLCDELAKRDFEDLPVPKTAYVNHAWMHSRTKNHTRYDALFKPNYTEPINSMVDGIITLPSEKILDLHWVEQKDDERSKRWREENAKVGPHRFRESEDPNIMLDT